MGIMPMFDKGAILNPVAAFQKQLELAFVTLLKYMGEKLAKYAKDSHNYQDQTGNLTNSIGYAVVQNKEIVYYGGSDHAAKHFFPHYSSRNELCRLRGSQRVQRDSTCRTESQKRTSCRD